MNRKLILTISVAFLMLICSGLVAYAGEADNANTNNQSEIQVQDETTEDGWVKNTDGTKSYYVSGVPVTGDYVIEGRHYYFDKDGIQKTGFFYVGDKKYFYDDYRKTGWQTINGYKYYFNPEMKTGLQTIDGYKYYFKNSMITGFVKLNNRLYYFKNHMRAGTIRINDKLYYFLKNGKAISNVNMWIRCGDTYKYAIGNGVIASGVKKIDSSLYLFNYKTGNRVSPGFHKYGNSNYYCLSSGKLATGWRSLKNYAYFFGKNNGKMARSQYIGYLYVPSAGYLGHSYARGIRILNKNGWTLYSAYKYSTTLQYANRNLRLSCSEKYANYGFTNGYGNCLVMAGTFYVQAKLLGYNVRQMFGYVVAGPHSWIEIKADGKWWVYDLSFKNGTGRSGWKLYYGQPGTWRYSNYKVLQNKNKYTI